MRKLVVTENITLDGSIEMLGEWFDPQGQGDMSELMEEIHRQDAAADALLIGRRTFEATGRSRPTTRPVSPTTSMTSTSTSSPRP
jgi:hypothetical protein